MRKQWMRQEWKTIFSMIFVLTLLFAVIPVPVYAAEKTKEETEKIVRVGYVNALNYEEGGAGEYKRGAGYEYLQKISYITGWHYEYVYGSFTECCSMLENGEIDLFGNVSYTPERAEKFDYSSYPQGKDTYWLYTTKDRTDLTTGDSAALNGSRIGVTEGSYQDTLLSQWLENNNVQAEVMRYSGYDAMMSAMNTGKVDVIAAPDLATGYDYISIASIGFSDFYFAVSKQRPDLLSELNSALYEIQNTESDYNNKLVSRYYYKSATGLSFNQEERDWLEAHDNTICLGYYDDALPFSGLEDGELIGILNTVTDTLKQEYKIDIQAKPYKSLKLMKQALETQEIDIIGPIISDFYLTEQDDLVLTDSIVDTTPAIIYKGEDYHDGLQVIAASDTTLFNPEITSVLFPDAQIYPCDSEEACLKAVADGVAGSTLVPSFRINILNANSLMKELSFAEMAQQSSVSLLTNKENRRAASIFNKGIEQSSDLLSGVVLAQHTAANDSMSVGEFVSKHAWLFIGMASLIILVLGTLLYRLTASQKQVVAALNEAENANTANIAKTTFLNNMSHDIRTPMNAIMGFTDIAMKQNPSEEIQGCLEKIRQSSVHLLSLLNDVLDISRIESGHIRYDPLPVDITAVTDSVLSISKGFMIDRNLRFQLHRNLPKSHYVIADEVRIREILINIISNAVKFTPDGGTITFETADKPGGDERHTICCWKITDTGIGISDKFIDHIFDEFSQENTDARTQYKGTGLGLAITKRYVDMMGGTIKVDSEKGIGTSVTVELPLELAEPESMDKISEIIGERDLSGLHILLAEDNDLNAELAAVLLEDKGMRVTRAVNGCEAVIMMRDRAPGTFDAILMDIMMPKMNGYEATQAIRQLPYREDVKTIPIIAMTANAFAEDEQKSMKAGMNAHLAKPLDIEKVAATIAKFCT